MASCGTKTMEDATGDKQIMNNNPIENKEKPSIYEVTKENLRFAVTSNQENDEIIIEASVTNVGNDSVEYYAGSSSCPQHIGIQVFSQQTENLSLIKLPEEFPICTDDIHSQTLEPGETVKEEVTILTIERVDSAVEPAYGNSYDVVVTFNPVTKEWGDPITATIEITIEGAQ
ncbi:MAG: hypothetical protein LRY71_09665 [Bacillaceae bacterium]|nr:hypothetical protein [Bacillaceae bacterium]